MFLNMQMLNNHL